MSSTDSHQRFTGNSHRLIAITGGIGSGKSVVSQILRTMGYDVYDSDTEARRLMDMDTDIKHRLAAEISADVIRENDSIDRTLLASIVFNDAEMLARLNSIVHEAVRNDLAEWAAHHEGIAFVETAILYQSGLDAMVAEVWEVDAPKEIRIERVMRRNSMVRKDVESRIASQSAFVPDSLHPCVRMIDNDGFIPVLPRVEQLLDSLSIVNN